MTKEQLKQKLVTDMADTVRQWVIQDDAAELELFLAQQMDLDGKSYDELEEMATNAGLIDEPTDHEE